MLNWLRIRVQGLRLGRELARRIVDQLPFHASAQVNVDSPRQRPFQGGRRWRLVIHETPIEIEISPRRIRFCDAVNVYMDGAEVWLPLLARLRVRNAARLIVLRRACDSLRSNESG